METWAQILGWEGRYSVSTEGRVRNDRSGRILKPMRTGTRRPGAQRSKVRFSSNPRVDFDVAHLVLGAFVGPRPEGGLAMHLNDDSADNSVHNLRWGTPKSNSVDCANKKRGSRQKVGPAEVAQIRALRAVGVPGVEVAHRFGISQQRVCDIHKGRFALDTGETP